MDSNILTDYYFDSKADMKKLNYCITGPHYMHRPNPTEPDYFEIKISNDVEVLNSIIEIEIPMPGFLV